MWYLILSSVEKTDSAIRTGALFTKLFFHRRSNLMRNRFKSMIARLSYHVQNSMMVTLKQFGSEQNSMSIEFELCWKNWSWKWPWDGSSSHISCWKSTESNVGEQPRTTKRWNLVLTCIRFISDWALSKKLKTGGVWNVQRSNRTHGPISAAAGDNKPEDTMA